VGAGGRDGGEGKGNGNRGNESELTKPHRSEEPHAHLERRFRRQGCRADFPVYSISLYRVFMRLQYQRGGWTSE
jgi:hypothetical protein